MGGHLSKDSFLQNNCDEEYKILNFFRLKEEVGWLCGGAAPLFKESLQYLKNENVGLIISLLVEPIKSGVSCNHLPVDFDRIEWTTSDDITEELKEFELVHIPVADSHGFYGENSNLFLKTIRDYHINQPNKSIYISCWTGSGRTSMAIIYTLMKFYDMNLDDTLKLLAESHDDWCLSEQQMAFLEKEQQSDLDLYNSKPEVRTPKDHKCYDKNEDEDEDRYYQIATSEVKYEHKGCRVCRHECDHIMGEDPIEPVFRTLPVQVEKEPIIIQAKTDDELEKTVPHFSDELRILSQLHTRRSILEFSKPTRETKYNFVTAIKFRGGNMITLVKRMNNYIVFFDQKGGGMMLDISIGHNSQAIDLRRISANSEMCTTDVLLYKDTDGESILVGYHRNNYGVWRCNDRDKRWITCHTDYSFQRKYPEKFRFMIIASGKMILITDGKVYYVSFQYETGPRKGYKLITELVPKDEFPLHRDAPIHVTIDSDDHRNISKQLSLASVPEEHLDTFTSKYYNRKPGQDERYIYTTRSYHQYDDIALVGHDAGVVTVWQSQ